MVPITSGGVVSNSFFQTHFGLVNPDQSVNVDKSNAVTSNVVSVLQAGAFFGALGSAPLSGMFASLNIHQLSTRVSVAAGETNVYIHNYVPSFRR